MFNKDELEDLLVNVGSKIEKPVSIYLIGGCALSFKGLKAATKDIDIIITSQSDFDIFDKAMSKGGFKNMNDRESEFYLTALAVYVKEESRIDVFLKQAGKMLFITPTIIKRARKFKDFGKLAVFFVSNEDIFLFKAMVSPKRQADIYDCDRLMKEGLNYSVIYDEIAGQSSHSKKWFFWLYENLCHIENFNGIKTPLKSKVFSLVKKYWKDKPSEFMSDVEDREKHIPDKKLLKELE
ncbi:nucleotidyltransferase [Candidatus Pacearchaeota archaeon]|nr:nucleotidyltransferase [Candidatus Pacearchaeota archaeon]